MIEKEKRSFPLGTWEKTSRGKVFARKLMRIGYSVEVEDAENEIKTIESLSRPGGHDHIIEVLKYGWLGTPEKFFFIDMELAELSLAEYIAYVFHNKPLPSGFYGLSREFDAVFSCGNWNTQSQRLCASLTISSQIAQGLEFV